MTKRIPFGHDIPLPPAGTFPLGDDIGGYFAGTFPCGDDVGGDDVSRPYCGIFDF